MSSSLRSRRMTRNHKRMTQQPRLNLVALMDIFTILVLFLMVNNGDVEVLQSDRDITLPESVSEQRPELAALKQQIQRVHGLLRDVGTGDSLTDDDDWRLSAEKRNAVLAVIGGDAEKQSAKRSLNKLAEKPRSVKGTLLWNLSKIAAVFCFVALSGTDASGRGRPGFQTSESGRLSGSLRRTWKKNPDAGVGGVD